MATYFGKALNPFSEQYNKYNGGLWRPLAHYEKWERVVWESHTVTLGKTKEFGFGIAVSGGRDNPHFTSGEPSVAISDVLPGGPAENRLQVNDRVLSVNGISLENVDHATAISVLKDSGEKVSLVIRRKVIVPASEADAQPFKVTLSKKNKKEDFGVVLGCKLYVKEVLGNSLAAEEGSLREGDALLRINGTPVENLSLSEARRAIEKTRDKLNLLVLKHRHDVTQQHSPHANGANQEPAYRSSHTPELPLKQHQQQQQQQSPYDSPGMKPVSFNELDRPATPLLQSPPLHPGPALQPHRLSASPGRSIYDEPPQRPPPPHEHKIPPSPPPQQQQRPHSDYIRSSYHGDYNGVGPQESHDEYDVGVRRMRQRPGPSEYRFPAHPPKVRLEPRYVSFKKDGGVGIRVTGGNCTGIFVAAVAPGTPADLQGLVEGDMILKVNNVDMRGKTREEAVLLMLSLQDHVDMLVQHRRDEYVKLMTKGGSGDSFYIRVHFNYDQTEHKDEMGFRHGDVFHVVDTLCGGVVGSWQAVRIGRNNVETQMGIIPNQSRADELAKGAREQYADKDASSKQQRGGSFFKKKVARRAKSLGRDHWEDVIFASVQSKFPAYERVVLRDPAIIRPVVVFGPLADVARERLVRDMPSRFQSPQTQGRRDDEDSRGGGSRAGIIKLNAIRAIINQGRHCVLDVTPNAVDRLNYAQYCPMVFYLRADSKQAVKDLRTTWARGSSKSARKLYEQACKLEKNFAHLFTHKIELTNGEIWYRKLKELIDRHQHQPVWMSETKPEEGMKDEFLFPMSNRLSYASSPESDLDIRPSSVYDDEGDASPMMPKRRLVRSSSDPSIATGEGVPGIPPYPHPPSYQQRSRDPRHPRHMDPIDEHHSSLYASNTDLPPNGHLLNGERDSPESYRHHTLPARFRQRRGPGSDNAGSNYGYHPGSGRYDDRYAPPETKLSPQQRHLEAYATLTSHDRHSRPRIPDYEGRGYFSDPDQRSPHDLDRGYGRVPRGPPAAPRRHPHGYRDDYGSYADPKNYDTAASYDPYMKYSTVHPMNQNDKVYDKFGAGPAHPASGGRQPPDRYSKHDPYRFTRSTVNPYKTATINKSKLSDLSAKYRGGEEGRAPLVQPEPDLLKARSESTLYREEQPPAHAQPQYYPAKSSSYLDRDEPAKRGYGAQHREDYDEYRDYALRVKAGTQPPPKPQRGGDQPSGVERRDRSAAADVTDRLNPAKRLSAPVNSPPTRDYSNYSNHADLGYVEPRRPEVPVRDERPAAARAFSNQTYADPADIHRSLDRDSGYPSSLERSSELRPSTYRHSYGFESYKNLISPGFYGAKRALDPVTLDPVTPERDGKAGATAAAAAAEKERNNNSLVPEKREHRNSAFESYKKPGAGGSAGGSPSTTPPRQDSEQNDPADRAEREASEEAEENHTVVATARGVFDSSGGVLESKETGVSIVIPKGAIQEGVQQEIYFKVCQDNSILPPLNKEKGETLLSPLVMCGPHGLKFQQPVELRLPHCASVNPESWSFALKSSDSPAAKDGGQQSQWQNMTLAGIDGVSQGRVGKNSVSVLVDHF